MNWLTNLIRPKIRSFVDQKEVPDNLWHKCPSCEGMLFHRDLDEHMNVCYHCNHHMKVSVTDRLAHLYDDGKYKEVPLSSVAQDPLKFKDRKRYADRLKDSRQKTGRQDAIVIAKGTINGVSVVTAAFDFSFMGGSMGAGVGEGVVKAAETAVKENAALLVIPASGGARMQEGLFSLMQMPRTIIAAEQVKAAGLPYIVLLTDPTTGGVSASFAMVGDVHIAEPGCTIGFAGKRVIQETIREDLPDGFQTAEYLQEHGMVDLVVPRKDLPETIGRILDLLCNKKGGTKKAVSGDKKNGNKDKSGQKKSGGGKSGGSVRMAKVQKNVTVKEPANVNARAPKKQSKKAKGKKA